MEALLLAGLLSLPGPAPDALPPVCQEDCRRFPDLPHCRRHLEAWESHLHWLQDHRLVTQGDYHAGLEERLEAARFMVRFWSSLLTAGTGFWSPSSDPARMEFIRATLGPDLYYRGWAPDWLPPAAEMWRAAPDPTADPS